MLAFSDIIDFLLKLLGDEAARAEFEQDPQGTLEQAGLEGVTAQDIRDARLQLADSGAVSAVDDGYGSSYPDGDDPVREIGYTAAHYSADDDGQHADASTVVTIDDRDTLFFQTFSDDDVTVTDNSVTISDSFNEDNSDDDLTAIQANGSFNSDDDVSINAQDSSNSDNDLVAIQDNDVNVDVDQAGDTGDPAGDTDDLEGLDDAPSADLAAVSGPAEPETDEPIDTADVTDEPEAADLGADGSDALAV